MTTVSPSGNTAGALLLIDTLLSTLSLAVAAARNAAISVSLSETPEPLGATTVKVDGTEITGLVVSGLLTGGADGTELDPPPPPQPDTKRNKITRGNLL